MPDFLSGGGECGDLIAARDWSSTLGPVERWPRSLKAVTGLLLRSPVPMVMLWGDDGIMLYNDAYSVFAGRKHPEQLGKPVREGWPEVADFNDHVMKVGLAGGTLSYKDQELTLYRNGQAEQVFMNLDYSPVLGDDGRPAGVLAVVVETTARIATEEALRRRESRLRFFDQLAQATRQSSDAREIMAVTVRALGEQLGGSVCAYADMDADQDTMNIRADWAAEGSGSIVGTYRLAAFGETAQRSLLAGQPFVTRDTLAELGPEEGKSLLALGLGATVCMPLVREGRLKALMALHSAGPRNWTDHELSLIAETTDRSWAHIERVRAELVIRESEERFRNLADSAPVMIWMTDADGRCTYLSRSWFEFTGQPSELDPDQGWLDAVHPDDRSRRGSLSRDAANEGAPFRMEYRLRNRDGGYYWVIDAAAPRHDRDGKFLGFVGSVVDINERKRTEERLRDTARRLDAVLNNTTQAVFLMDDRQHCIFANAAAEKLTGYSFAELSGQPLHDVVHHKHPDGRPYPLQDCPIDRAFPERAQVQGEELFVAPDGSFYPVAFTASPVLDDDGTAVGTVIEARNITAEKAREAAVRESEARLRAVIEQMPIGVAVARVPDGKLIQYNEALTRMLGHPDLSEGAGTYAPDGGVDDRGEPLPAEGYPLFRAVRFGETVVNNEMRYRRGDGRIIHLLGNAAPIVGASGTAEIAVVTLQDITDHKKAQQHQRLLIDELSHRAKNLLAIIQSVAQQSFKGEGSPAEMVSRFEGRLGALAAAHGILTKQKWEAAPIRQIVCDTITAVKADDERLKLEGPDLMVSPKTGVSLAMAVHELATNALKYGSFSDERGTVAVSWMVEGGRLRFTWQERGGPVVTPPGRRGFGSRMIERGLAAELGGTVRIDFQAEGVVCTVDAPFREAA